MKNNKENIKLTNKQIYILLLLIPFYLFGRRYILAPLLTKIHIISNDSIGYIFTYYTMLIILAVFFLIIIKEWLIDSFKSFLSKGFNNNQRIITRYFFKMLFVMLAFYIINVLGQSNSFTTINQELVDQDFIANPILMSLLLLSAPIFEELIFRGIIFNFIKIYNEKLALWLTIFFFALIHVHFHTNMSVIHQMLPYLGMGYILTDMYKKESNIFYCIVLHMMWNFLGVIIKTIQLF